MVSFDCLAGFWHRSPASVYRQWTPGVKNTTAGGIYRAGHLTLDHLVLPFILDYGIRNRHSIQQGAGIRMHGVVKQLIPIGEFNQITQVHDGHAVGDVTLRGADGTTETVPADSVVVAVTAEERALTCDGDPAAVATMQDALAASTTGEQEASDFVAAFDGWHANGDVDALAASLHPAVLHRYGAEQCAAYLDGVVGTISEIEVAEQRSEPMD